MWRFGILRMLLLKILLIAPWRKNFILKEAILKIDFSYQKIILIFKKVFKQKKRKKYFELIWALEFEINERTS